MFKYFMKVQNLFQFLMFEYLSTQRDIQASFFLTVLSKLRYDFLGEVNS